MPRSCAFVFGLGRLCAGVALCAMLGNAGADERALIGAGAFGGAQGVIAVNQASGLGNSQSNAVVLGIGASLSIATDGQLAAVSPRPGSATGPVSTTGRTALIESSAFHAAAGVVQVNQTAGLDNATGNTFVLQMPGLSLSNSRSLR